jgi:ribosomal protein S18 acetylase RimI-like enzyme
MSILIRKAEEHDFASILELLREFSIFQGTPEKLTINLTEMLQEKEIFLCFIAETENKEIVGLASCFFAFYSWTGKALYLDDLYVKESFRNQGIGKNLMDSVIQLAKTEKCRKIRWQVSKWNTNAIRFYKSMGAVIDEVEINCDLPLPRQ